MVLQINCPSPATGGSGTFQPARSGVYYQMRTRTGLVSGLLTTKPHEAPGFS
jgi:hypothetical protein